MAENQVLFATGAIIAGIGVILASPTITGMVGIAHPATTSIGTGIAVTAGVFLVLIAGNTYLKR